MSVWNRIEQAELGYWIHYATFREDQPPDLEWRRLERSTRFDRVRARVSRETGRAVDVISCYEAGYDGFWLHRLLEAHGIRNYVIDPASLQVDRRARRVKTDRIDTERLLRSLMAYLRGEPKVWSVVRVPSVAEEDARRLHRERDRLVSERVQHVNRIKGLCALHGICDYPRRREGPAAGTLKFCSRVDRTVRCSWLTPQHE